MDRVWYQTDEVSLYHSPALPSDGLWLVLASSDPRSHHLCLQPCMDMQPLIFCRLHACKYATTHILMPRSIGIKISWQRQGCSPGNPASAASVPSRFILEHAEADSGLCGGSQIRVRVISCLQQDREPGLHTQGEAVLPAVWAAFTLPTSLSRAAFEVCNQRLKGGLWIKQWLD